MLVKIGSCRFGVEDAGVGEGVQEEVGDDVGVGPPDFVGVFELVDHALPFFFTVFIDDDMFPVVAPEVHAHSDGIGFGVELGADHGIGEANGHDRSFERDVGSFFLDGEDAAAHVGYALVVGLDHLEAATVDCVEGVLQAGENGFFGGAFEEVYGENAKCGGAAAGDFGDGVMAADKLEGVADEEDLFPRRGICLAIVCFNLGEPVQPGFFPGAAQGIEWAAGTAA